MDGNSDSTLRPFAGASVDISQFRRRCDQRGVAVSQAMRGWDLAGLFASTDEVGRWFQLVRAGGVHEGSAPALTESTVRRIWHLRLDVGESAPASTVHPDLLAADRRFRAFVPNHLPSRLQAVLAQWLAVQLLIRGADRVGVDVPVGDQRSAASWHLPDAECSVDGQRAATVPCWRSRGSWMAALGQILATTEGQEALSRHAVSRAKVEAAARVCANAADGATGRHCALSHERIATEAKVSESVSKRVRRVLVELGFAVVMRHGRRLNGSEMRAAARHHGQRQRGVASDLSLTVPQGFRPAPDPLPSCGFLSSCSSVLEVVTKRASARSSRRSKLAATSTRRSAVAPSAAVKRLVAGLLARSWGLDPGVGQLWRLWAVVARSGIDPAQWTAAQVVRQLDLDAHRNGISWPDRLERPDGYLAWRLSRVDWNRDNVSASAANDSVQQAAPSPLLATEGTGRPAPTCLLSTFHSGQRDGLMPDTSRLGERSINSSPGQSSDTAHRRRLLAQWRGETTKAHSPIDAGMVASIH